MNALPSIRGCLVALAMACLAGCASPPPAMQVVPLPVLPQGPVDMRVAYAVNPRLPRMDAAQLQLLLASMGEAVRQNFGIELRFSPVTEVPIASLFATIPARRRDDAARDSYDFKSGRGDRARLDKAFTEGFRSSGESMEAMRAFALPHTGPIAPGDTAFGARIAALQLERVALWSSRQALDGGPAIDNTPFNEFPMWLALGFGDVPYELVLTNQLIAGVELTWPAVHTAVRGGYSNGITTYSRLARYGTVSVWSTYAFGSNDAQLVQLRGGESYTPHEAARLAGLSGAHEIGHQLLHLLHPYGQAACLMHPVEMLAYRDWASKLSPRDCPVGSSPAMTPGVYKFEY
ncbi:hypothetical protein [uncultured Ramlibacter sp.]|uniref:hypothetical protein n=1 Tax=uncultured Ramlibacter sp. TaxID=260755 RepID=UPI0026345C4F|nr:hypothetical protein [uncultured Ramlibacter sp.]